MLVKRLFVCGIMMAAIFTVSAMAQDVKISGLRSEYAKNPLGIEVKNPRLSWLLESSVRGQKQTAYQVLVASSNELLEKNQGNLWDSGKVSSGESIHIIYKGKELTSFMSCFWKVRVWDKDGKESGWSEPALWSMGLLNSSDWKAKWIGLDRDDPQPETQDDSALLKEARWLWYPEGNPLQSAPIGKAYFRGSFDIPKGMGSKIKSAKLVLTADNSFTFWVNGSSIGIGNNHSVPYIFELLRTVKEGKNVITAEVDNVGATPNPAGFIAALRIDFESDSSNNQPAPVILTSSSNWKVSKKPADGWQTQAFNDSEWQAAKDLGAYGIQPWGDLKKADPSKRLSARYLRKEKNLDKKVQSAVAYISGMGLFELRINGSKIGDHVLEPGLTEYSKRVFYETFDVTKNVQQGVNVLAVLLGNGRFFAPRQEVPISTRTFGYPKLLFQLHIQYDDNTSDTLISDESWKITTNGPIRANNEYDGEEYDAQMEMDGWDKPAFNDSAWEKVQLVKAPEGTMHAQNIEPIRVTGNIKPIAVNSPQKDMYVFDMGQNMVGWCQLKVKGSKGAAVKMRFAEVLKPDGTLYLDNIRSAKVTDIYTLKGSGDEIYEPRFTYHGFRYVEVTGFPGKPTLETILGCVVNDDVEEAGEFVTSNPLLNQIHKNIYWGVRGNYRSFPTDCPQRDERQAWLGDRAAESKGETFLFDISRLYAKWMNDIQDSQQPNGTIPSVCPYYWPIFPNDVTWPSAYTIVPGSLYEQYGDTRVLEDQYAGMKKWLTFLSGFLKDGIMPQDTYGDWCVPPESPELIHSQDPARRTSKEVLGTTYYYHNLCLLARYATILGKEADAKDLLAQAEAIKTAFNNKFFNKEKNQYDNGSQTSFVLPLAFDMAPADVKAKVFEHLVSKITKESKNHIGTGLIGGQWLNRVLSDNGRADLAYTIATQKTYPSWGYMVEKGATTVWELWNGDTADPAMNSGNHVMLVGDLNIWFVEYLGGIKADPEQPAFKHIIMKPHPVGDLKSVKATYKSIHGPVASEWNVDAGNFKWSVQVPVNTTAAVFVPAASEKDVTEGGKPVTEAKGVKFQRMDGNYAVFAVESGNYAFAAKMN